MKCRRLDGSVLHTQRRNNSTIFLHFTLTGGPSQGEIVSDSCVRHASTPPTFLPFFPTRARCHPPPSRMKKLLFNLVSFQMWRGAAPSGGCRAWRVGRNWTAFPHYCKHHPSRQAGRQVARTQGGGWGCRRQRDPLKHIH